MKVFLRSFNTRINGRTGELRPAGSEVAAADRWRGFEGVLRDGVRRLGHQLIEQPSHPHQADRCGGADRHIYAHASRHERPVGDWFYKEMHLPGLFTLDSQGWGVEHSGVDRVAPDTDLDEAQLAACMAVLRRRYFSAGQSRLPQPATVPASLPGDYLLAPLQVPDDYVIRHHSSLTVAEFVHLLADWAWHRRRAVVFKRHPGSPVDGEVDRALTQRVDPDRYCHLADGNIHALIRGARGVVVINSGTGFEALIHGRPVVTLGCCDYNAACLHTDPAGLDAALAAIDQRPEQRLAAWRWVYSYHQRHAYSVHPECLTSTQRRVHTLLEQSLGRAHHSHPGCHATRPIGNARHCP